METIVFLVLVALLAAFWMRQWHNYDPAAGGMTNRRVVLWSLGLSLPVQYCWLLAGAAVDFATIGITRGGNGDYFGCSNFHGSGLTPCSFGEMLMNRLIALLLINFVSFGVAFLFTAAIIGGVLLGWRLWRGKRSSVAEQNTL